MDFVYCIIIEVNERKFIYDIGTDMIDCIKTARIMTATDPLFYYKVVPVPYQDYLKMIRISREKNVTVCSLVEDYLNSRELS